MATIGTLVAQITGDTAGLRRAERDAKKHCGGIENSLKSMKRIAISAFAGWGIARIGRSLIDTSVQFTRFRITLQTLEGSMATGTAKWKEMLTFAEKTPFSIQQVMQSYIQLRAYGVEPTIKTMTALGDAVAATGGQADAMQGLARAIGQIQSTGRITAQDLNQLATYGINAAEIMQEKFGVARDELKNLGKQGITSGQIINAIFQSMTERFGGQMSKIASTMVGQWEELLSIVERVQDQIMQAGPEAEITKTLKEINAALNDLSRSGTLENWANNVATAVLLVINVGRDLVDVVGQLWDVMIATPEGFIDFFTRAEDKVEEATKAVDEQRTSYEKLVNYMSWLGKTMLAAFKMMLKEFGNFLGYMLKAIADFVKNAGKWLKAWYDLGVSAFTFDKEGITKAWSDIWGGVLDETIKGMDANAKAFEAGAKEAWDEYVKAWGNVPDLVEPVINKFEKAGEFAEKFATEIRDVGESAEKAGNEVDKACSRIDSVCNAAIAKLIKLTDKAKTAMDRIILMALPEYKRGLEVIHREYEQANKDLDKYGKLNGKTVAEIAQLHKDLGLRMGEDLAEYAKSHEETTEKVSEAWINAYNKISDTLADWIQTGKFNLGNFFDWIKRALAQLAATKIIGSAVMTLGLPGAAAWAGVGAGGSAMGGGAGGGGSQSLYGAGASLIGGLWQGMGNVGTTMSILPTNITASIGSAFSDWGFSSGKDFMKGLNTFFANHASISGGLTAGLGTFLLTGLMTGDWGQAAWAGGGAGLGAAIGTAIFPGIGTFLGGLGGGFIGKLFGGIFGGNIKRGYLGQKYEYTKYSPESGWGEGEMVDQWREDRNGDDWIESADEMAQSGLDLMNAMDSTFKKLLGAFGGEEYVTRFTTAMGKFAMGENPEAETYAGQAPLGTHGLAFSYYISAEDEDEFKEDWLRSWKRMTQGLINPIVDTGTNLLREALDETISDSSVWNYFTDDFKTYIEDNLEKSLGDLKVDWSQVTDEESLKKALETMDMAAENIGAIIEHFDKIGAIMDSISGAIEMHGLSEAAQNAIHSFRGINAQFATFATTLETNGIDLEKYTDLEKTHQLALQDAAYAMAQAGIDGNDFAIALEKMREEMEEAGKTAEEVAGAINAAMKGVIDSIGDIYRELEHGGPLSLAETIADHYKGMTAADIEGISNARWRAITEEVADAWAAAGSPSDYGTWAKETYGAQLVADWNDWGAHLRDNAARGLTNGITRPGGHAQRISPDYTSQLDSLRATLHRTIDTTGLDSYQKALYNIREEYKKHIADLKKWGGTVEDTALATEVMNVKLKDLRDSIISNIIPGLQEIIDTHGMGDYEKGIYNVSHKYRDYIKQMMESELWFDKTGKLTEEATLVLQAFNIELGNLADREAELARQKAEQAVTEARNNLIGALQREISEYQEAQNALQSAFDTAKSAYISGLQAEISIKQDAIRTIKDTISSFDNLLDSISDYRKELVTSANVLSPDMQYKMAQAQFAEAVQGLYSGDQEVIQKSLEDIPGLGKKYLDTSLAANADFNDYMADFSKVMATLNTAEDIGKVQKTVAKRSLDALDSQVGVLEQTLSTLQEQLLPLAELQANYNNAKWALDTSVYSALIEADQVQLAALQAINNSVLSVAEALGQYHQAQAARPSLAPTPESGWRDLGGDVGIDFSTDTITLPGGDSIDYASWGYSDTEALADARAGLELAGITPKFALGGTISGPESGYQMPATFHGVEHITPDSQMKEVKETLKEVKGVLIQLRDTNGDQNKTNKKLYRIIDSVSQGKKYLMTKAV